MNRKLAIFVLPILIALFAPSAVLGCRRVERVSATVLTGDINQDGVVSLKDLTIIADAFQTYTPEADMDGNKVINIIDILMVAIRHTYLKVTFNLKWHNATFKKLKIKQYWWKTKVICKVKLNRTNNPQEQTMRIDLGKLNAGKCYIKVKSWITLERVKTRIPETIW